MDPRVGSCEGKTSSSTDRRGTLKKNKEGSGVLDQQSEERSRSTHRIGGDPSMERSLYKGKKKRS